MKALRAPFPWFGGKSRAASTVWAALGPVNHYIEPFAGSLAVLLARPPARQNEPRTETINDADGFIVNFWRAVRADVDSVARWCDWPVSELDLTARHLWLVERREAMTRQLEADPDYCDPKIAGWWVWGISAWIGSGWCSGSGPWVRTEAGVVKTKTKTGIHRQLPHLSTAGTGIHRQLPHLGNAGMGVHRQLPHLGDAGRGVHRKAPQLGQTDTEVTQELRELADRLRYCRMITGDWSRVVTNPLLRGGVGGVCGVFVDPPYPEGFDPDGTYGTGCDADKIWREVREWAEKNGNDPKVRIVVAGYEGTWDPPAGWTTREWSPIMGYASDASDRKRERLWCSPSCLSVAAPSLFAAEVG